MKKTKLIAGMYVTGSWLLVISGWSQVRNQPLATIDPCPGGGASALVEPVEPPLSLANLVNGADVVVLGTVVQNLPPVLSSPTQQISIETHSLIQVDQLLLGALPPNATSVAIAQIGGELAPCKLTVDDDPIVKLREQFLLFLKRDDRTMVPNTSGAVRFNVVGVWSGKIKVVNGKIQFPPAAAKGLHKYDNMELGAFANLITKIAHPSPPPSPYSPAPIPPPPSSPFSTVVVPKQ